MATAVAGRVVPAVSIGIARRAEPSPGLRVDWLVLGPGVVGIAAFVLVIGLLAAYRATNLLGRHQRCLTPVHARRTLAQVLAKTGLRPPVTNGMRMALEPGRGTRALPVRSAVRVSAVFGAVGLAAALVFRNEPWPPQFDAPALRLDVGLKAADDSFDHACGTKDYGLTHQRGVGAVRHGLLRDCRDRRSANRGMGLYSRAGSIETRGRRGTPRERAEPDRALGQATLRMPGKADR